MCQYATFYLNQIYITVHVQIYEKCSSVSTVTELRTGRPENRDSIPSGNIIIICHVYNNNCNHF
jgi:hypothetical protein